jgi:cytochrome c
MWKCLKLAVLGLIVVGPAQADRLNLGREATPAEVAAWNIDVRPDGEGLPQGSGDVATGEEVFAERCAFCHGDFGEGVDRWPVLAGGQDTLTEERPVKTIGSYWPYLSTVYDYIYRAMPFGEAQSLTPDEVYAITAYLLYMNDVVADEDFTLSHENLTEIRLPNEENFFEDPRPDTPTLSEGAPCMQDCKPAVEITMRAVILDVTPESGEDSGLTVE